MWSEELLAPPAYNVITGLEFRVDLQLHEKGDIFHTRTYVLGWACVDPPVPNETRHLVLSNWVVNQTYNFGQEAIYVCEDGYFFDEDYNGTDVRLTCLADGSWTNPLPWTFCDRPPGKDRQVPRWGHHPHISPNGHEAGNPAQGWHSLVRSAGPDPFGNCMPQTRLLL